jgi:DNA repair photolyase
MNDFTQDRTGHGTQEWAEINANIQQGCSNACLYCYANANALRFGKIKLSEEWTQEKINWKAVRKPARKRKGVTMFPTAHDITQNNLPSVLEFLDNLLAPGNKVLIVSKPDPVCIADICSSFKKYRDQILFRFTIGTTDIDTSIFWEPGAPLPGDRIEALKHAAFMGYQTSVSMEPMLAGTGMAIDTYRAVEPYVTETVWIGKMNRMRERIEQTPANLMAIGWIEEYQKDSEILKLVAALKDEPKVRWKDSIKEIIARYGEVKHA